MQRKKHDINKTTILNKKRQHVINYCKVSHYYIELICDEKLLLCVCVCTMA